MPRNRNVLHPEAFHVFSFAVGPLAARIDHDVYSHFCEVLETFLGWLGSTEKFWSDLAEVWDAFDLVFLSEHASGARGRDVLTSGLLFLGRADRDAQQEWNRERSKRANN